ncbi:hypoxanthine phosphoribosyltransferase [Spiroplasma culicicola]|uniref:Hypoxanthine phosphoribosyltransferase n=1 Tax=Spiroplasma culicicola AES-1 TaxID=1276246 RepID=W6A624_9MOLU|nr:hypoxanthine phosphoribosyltransferase [Spiroplasma culicicola]AHI52573.1 hypoxanthine-guanine phosphoribosyltransferase [Spiroplasma culicicola AES-1]
MHPLVKEILFTKEQIDTRTAELGKEISEFYQTQDVKDNTVILIGLLKGCVPFMANFLNHFTYECQTEFMVVSSYLGGLKTSGEPKINLDLNLSIKGKTILIVEDIVDSGLTLTYVKQYLEFKGAKDVRIVSLLDKPEGRKTSLNPNWYGFTVQKQFLIGYGLDYEERLRNLPYVAICDTSKLDDWKW